MIVFHNCYLSQMAWALEMLPVLAHLQNLHDLMEEEDTVQNWRVERKRLRDSCDPFMAPKRQFQQNFRISKNVARALIQRLAPHFPPTRRSSLTPTHRVLAALKFFASGSYQRGCVAEHNAINMCQTSVSDSLAKVMEAMIVELGAEVIRFPQTAEERAAVQLGFYEKFGMPGVIGAIDGTLICIKPPILNEEQFFSRKQSHSINTQIICDSNLKILNVNPRHGGATNDAFIWKHSTVFQYLRDLVINQGVPYVWLLGDSGYPLQPWLLTPIVGADPDSPQGRYTKAHILARNTVERVNGVLKQKWRCVKKDRVLHYDPAAARKIINCCAILHNIALQAMPDWLDDEELPAPPVIEPVEPVVGNHYLERGRQVRANLITARYT
ncbi:putative nuclease HARBI1 [Bemisia tabaci]|uniref:putative nuclease HARBI1 n=1 Tax=Bemisia tabaci TaxID=7038 RepID=UPI003B27B402